MAACSGAAPLFPTIDDMLKLTFHKDSWIEMLRRLGVNLIDYILGWRSRSSGGVVVGQGTTMAWRRIRGVSDNRLLVGNKSIIHANIIFEEKGGEIRIGSRSFIGLSSLICYRSLSIGDDVIMSWGITVVDHDSHSIEWERRQNDVCDWARGSKDWRHIASAPVVISNKVWIGFQVSVLKGVTIGEGAVIGACSVVTRDVPPYSLAVGNPARVVRSLKDVETCSSL